MTTRKRANTLARMTHHHPGAILRDWLKTNQKTQTWIAAEARIPQSVVSELVKCKRRIHAGFALRLAPILGVAAEELVARQALHELDVERAESAEVAQ